jgi:hypothetical protein
VSTKQAAEFVHMPRWLRGTRFTCNVFTRSCTRWLPGESSKEEGSKAGGLLHLQPCTIRYDNQAFKTLPLPAPFTAVYTAPPATVHTRPACKASGNPTARLPLHMPDAWSTTHAVTLQTKRSGSSMAPIFHHHRRGVLMSSSLLAATYCAGAHLLRPINDACVRTAHHMACRCAGMHAPKP